ncbi:MAG: hypothetical protein ACFCGT_11690 [Sandaracinaceae bacterium]
MARRALGLTDVVAVAQLCGATLAATVKDGAGRRGHVRLRRGHLVEAVVEGGGAALGLDAAWAEMRGWDGIDIEVAAPEAGWPTSTRTPAHESGTYPLDAADAPTDRPNPPNGEAAEASAAAERQPKGERMPAVPRPSRRPAPESGAPPPAAAAGALAARCADLRTQLPGARGVAVLRVEDGEILAFDGDERAWPLARDHAEQAERLSRRLELLPASVAGPLRSLVVEARHRTVLLLVAEDRHLGLVVVGDASTTNLGYLRVVARRGLADVAAGERG